MIEKRMKELAKRAKIDASKQEKKEGKELSKKINKDVEFTVYAPEAKNVYLAGEFNQWDTRSLPMKKDKEGKWNTTLKLASGRYEYKIFADRTWVENIPDVEAASNHFGTRNLVIWVK